MGLRNYWRFNGDASDAVGGATPTITNGSFTPGVPGSAIQFPTGSLGYVSFGNVLDFTSEDFTISFMFYAFSWDTTNVDKNTPILFIKGPGYNTGGYYTQISSGGLSLVTNQSAALQVSSGTYAFSLNTWYHIAFARQGASVRTYVNGTDVTTTAGTHVNPTSSATPFYINWYQAAYPIIGWDKYDEFKAEARKWSPAEIKNEYMRLRGFF